MKIYTRNGVTPYTFNGLPIDSKNFKELDECQFELDDIFYYDRHDLAIRNIEFDSFINQEHWDHVKNNPNVKILINFSDDYFNILDVDRISDVLKNKFINPNQIFFLSLDDNFKNFAVNEFNKRELFGINVQSYNVLLNYINFNNEYESKSEYKFSLLSRNYYPWRLSILLGLLNNNVLKYFNYSFHNFVPYDGENGKIISLDKVKIDAINNGYTLNSITNEWIDNLPYDLGNRRSKFSDVTYNAISISDFHLLIESHYDPFLFSNFGYVRKIYKIEDFSPAFPTEKTWKAIFCKKPFIVVAAPYFLKDLKKMGFKTFSPFINELYDNEEDNNIRIKMIINETSRICNLPNDEYMKILEGCSEIVKHNYKVLEELHHNIKFTDNFKWLNDLKFL